MSKVLSIVIAAYNVEAYLESTLRSCILEEPVLQSAYEVLVINDGSKDRTRAIAGEFSNQYPEVFRVIDKSNGGYGSVINEGIRVAEGKYFKLLDGDDWYDTNSLAEMIMTLKTCNSDMVLTDYTMVHEGSGKRDVLRYDELAQKTELPIRELRKRTRTLTMHSICYKTDVLRKLPMPITEHCFYTDMEYALFGEGYAKSVIYYPIALYQYRIGREGQSVSVEGIKKHIGDLEKVITDIDIFYDLLQEGENKELVNYQTALIYYGYLTYLLLLPHSGEIRRKIKAFDRKVKVQYPERYQWMENRKIRILRVTRYWAYGLCRLYCKWEKVQDEQ